MIYFIRGFQEAAGAYVLFLSVRAEPHWKAIRNHRRRAGKGGNMSKLIDWRTRAYAVLVLFAMTGIALPAQTFTTLFSFNNTDGEGYNGLVQGTDGNFYGTSPIGGTNPYKGVWGGTVFRVTPSGTLTTLYNFCAKQDCADGQSPYAGMVLGTDGNFYGTTSVAASLLSGTAFKITPSGSLTTLYTFCSQIHCADGSSPAGPVVQAADGDFYGKTNGGAANSGNVGTVFQITPAGALTTLYNFCAQPNCTDGKYAGYGALIQATDGSFYGTTLDGGATNGGTIFKITPNGTLTTLYSFCVESACRDGATPYGGLSQATDGDFYGTTYQGGDCVKPWGCGTVFKITSSGSLTTLHRFCEQPACLDGANPEAGLIQASDGNLYGTTSTQEPDAYTPAGTIFKITPTGALTALYSFCSQSGCPDGAEPIAPLLQATDGKFYGTTVYGGANGAGTIFNLSVGLGPFVKGLPHSGQVGQIIRILGTDLTGATSVTFSGTPATFPIDAATEITATVPAGATTGTLQVTTPTGTLLSAGPFTVLP